MYISILKVTDGVDHTANTGVIFPDTFHANKFSYYTNTPVKYKQETMYKIDMKK